MAEVTIRNDSVIRDSTGENVLCQLLPMQLNTLQVATTSLLIVIWIVANKDITF